MSGAMPGSEMPAWRRVLYLPPHSLSQRQPIFLGNTAEHAPNAPRFVHATTVKQSNAPRFTYFIE